MQISHSKMFSGSSTGFLSYRRLSLGEILESPTFLFFSGYTAKDLPSRLFPQLPLGSLVVFVSTWNLSSPGACHLGSPCCMPAAGFSK